MPVTKTISPASAPARDTAPPAGTQPRAVREKAAGPGVLTVSPPIRKTPKRA